MREACGLIPWFWGRPGLEPGASRMRRPRANPLGNLCTPFRWRVPSKGALFPTLEPIGVHLFRHGNLRFLTHNGAFGLKMDANESCGRRAPFQICLPPSKYQPKNQKRVAVRHFCVCTSWSENQKRLRFSKMSGGIFPTSGSPGITFFAIKHCFLGRQRPGVKNTFKSPRW